ncbi:hypothetical protein CTAYLR_005583 [Chrysophaeum taylorii]|uniref:Uncharacterized protein n=1 Tax=Chrysophaeum taylorii TaxID=2483200 RepID=A0AAD7XJ45_9STRA|nr:hypothetical protein CTAYLR_005583 [Chrysophaeum taylorii]
MLGIACHDAESSAKVVIEGAESVDAHGQVICQSSLRVRTDGVPPLSLSLRLTPDQLEPVFSGAAWAGTVLWRAAVRLVEVALLGRDFSGATVIELGAGLGVPAMICARKGAASVVVTEQATLVDLLERNVRANFDGRIVCRELDWSRENANALCADLNATKPFDFILCCDCVYLPLYGDSFYRLADAIDALAGPDSHVFLALERRHVRDGTDGVDAFLDALDRFGFAIADTLPSEPPVDILHLRRR